MLPLSTEMAKDFLAVETLLDVCFTPGRKLLSSYQLRQNIPPVRSLCMIARDELNIIIGSIRYWPISIEEKWLSLLLGPVAVHPTRQGEGVGAALIETSLKKATQEGWLRVILIGDEPYYSRFGFSNALARALIYPPPTNPDRVMARALQAQAMDGLHGRVHRIGSIPSSPITNRDTP